MTAGTDRIRVTRLDEGSDRLQALARDVREGLTATPKQLPPKWFYDARGSELFEQITQLPEYDQTRTEAAILERVAEAVVAEVPGVVELVELGSGASRKTRALLEALHAAGGTRYVPLDVSADALLEAASALVADHPWLTVDGVVGDFSRDLGALPRTGPAVVAFLGSTLGNLHPSAQPGFVASVAAAMRPGDAFLLGADLVPGPGKTVAELEAGYDDAAGVTAEFNRNVLAVVARELDAEVDPLDFDHVARWRPDCGWLEMALRARRDLAVRIGALSLDVPFARGEEVRTELSCKFTRDGVEALLAGAGLEARRWDTDARGRFAVALGVLP